MGTIEGTAFDSSVFNAYEQANPSLLVECEKSLAGEAGYALDQSDYNINNARQGFLDS